MTFTPLAENWKFKFCCTYLGNFYRMQDTLFPCELFINIIDEINKLGQRQTGSGT